MYVCSIEIEVYCRRCSCLRLHTCTCTCVSTTLFYTAVTLCMFTMKEGESVQTVFPSGRFTTVSQIQEAVIKALGISEESSPAFSIWLSSKHLRKCHWCIVKSHLDCFVTSPVNVCVGVCVFPWP